MVVQISAPTVKLFAFVFQNMELIRIFGYAPQWKLVLSSTCYGNLSWHRGSSVVHYVSFYIYAYVDYYNPEVHSSRTVRLELF